MAITVLFLGFLLFACTVALVDWRRGWLMALAVGVLQDPARKLTPNTPVVMTFSIVAVYVAILFAARPLLQRAIADLGNRFSRLYVAFGLFFICLMLAAINGLATYGMSMWKVPALSLFIYVMPVTAVVLGYIWAASEASILSLFRYYAVITSIALIGTPLEYMKVNLRALGMVALPEGFIRHLPGIQIRILSGFYRAPDIMGWHAAMLAIVGIGMVMHARKFERAWPWILVASWGFYNTIISGRRKAVYMVVVFALTFLWRYYRRLTMPQIISLVFTVAAISVVIHNISANEVASVYTKFAAATSEEEIFARLEGGMRETIKHNGLMG